MEGGRWPSPPSSVIQVILTNTFPESLFFSIPALLYSPDLAPLAFEFVSRFRNRLPEALPSFFGL